jgi:hypothetical protein
VREIRLERLNASHLGDVRALVADPEVLRCTRIPEPPLERFAETWIEGVMRSIRVKQGRRSDAGLWSRLPSDLDP